ncbi:MAG: enoyl-CoA hydratase-related protein, partial [Dehalococcoidia bacterium]
ELVFTDDLISAQEAKDLGILNRLVPHDRLQEETMALARQIAEGPPTALKLAKLLITKGLRMDWDTAVEFAATAQTVNLPSRDHKEGADAFREKRKPTFTGF